jgi:hypothetical protein
MNTGGAGNRLYAESAVRTMQVVVKALRPHEPLFGLGSGRILSKDQEYLFPPGSVARVVAGHHDLAQRAG